jgi:benzoyl-CoA reductase/2-hydroxyglutaryl-CoA dehydratase subunit BcrC/BadD/HgdB
MSALGTLQLHYRRRDLAARAWKQQGQCVAGFLCHAVPEEMIIAAGLLPYRLSGNPASGTALADKYTEPFYAPDVRSILNMLLTGAYDFLDLLIIPHTRHSVLQMYYHLKEIQEIENGIALPPLYLLDTLGARFWQSGQYSRDRLHEFRHELSQLSGREISDVALSHALATVNRNKAWLQKVKTLRLEDPPRLSGTQALQVIGSSQFMPKEEANKLLEQFLDETAHFSPREGVRLFVAGSPLDNTQFYEIVESCNATIVGEDSCWGNGYIGGQQDSSQNPMEVIARRYLDAPCSHRQSIGRRTENLVRRALEVKAQGVIFYFLEWDNAPAWEYPDQKQALEAKGIPTISFEMQKYHLSEYEREQTKNRIEAFVQSTRKADDG